MTGGSPIAQAAQTPASRQTSPGQPSSISAANYAFLQKFIHDESGIVIEADKQYLLESRLLPIIKSSQIESLDALSTRLAARSSPDLSRLVIEAMTTNETLFFRDPVMFDALRKSVLPEYVDRLVGKRKIRIWSAAASTGQEAYSLAILLQELGYSNTWFDIVGTDISNQVLDRAREGKYGQFEINRGLPAPYLMKYFTRKGLAWQIKDEIREMVRFEQLDLRRNFASLGNFDLVLCRNVLIYFDTATKRKIVESIRELLFPGGALVLGCAETVINIHDGLQRNTIGQSTFYTL